MSTVLQMTRHAVLRSAQRGIALSDLDLIEWIGTEVDDGYLVRDKDFEALKRELSDLLDRASRIVGKRLVVSEGRVVTAYHARRKKARSLLRRAEEKSLAD
jgi:hypothetical protein